MLGEARPRAHLAEAAHIDIDRARAELAAARRRGRHLAETRKERPGDKERGPHLGDELGRRIDARDLVRADADLTALDVELSRAPSERRRSIIVQMSARSGTLLRTHSSEVSSVAASAGSAAFFAPPIDDLALERPPALDPR